MKPHISLYWWIFFSLFAGSIASCSSAPVALDNGRASVTPYLGIGAAATLLLIAILILFTRKLQARAQAHTQELEKALLDLQAADTRLRENQKFLANLVEYSEAVILVKDTEGRYELVNRKYEEVMGLKREDVIGHTAIELFPEPIGKQFHAVDMAVIEAGKAAEMEEILDEPQGRRYFLSVKFPLHDESGGVRGMCGMSTEITERKLAETALREAETKYHALVENAPEVIYLDQADETSSCVYISPHVKDLLGYSAAEFARNPQLWHDLIHPEDYARAARSIEATLIRGGAVEEYRMITRDGEAIWVRDTSVLIRDKTGKGIFIQGFLHDVTERKQIEEKLLESEKRYRTLFEDSPIPLLEEDFSEVKKYVDNLKENGVEDLRAYFKENLQAVKQCVELARVVDLNKTVIQWYGAKSEAQIRGRLSQLIAPEWYGGFIEELLALIQNGASYEISVSRLDYNGNPLHVIIKGVVVPGCEDTWERVLISIMDVTQRKQAEEDLAKQLERLRGLRAIDQAIITNFDLSENLNILIREIVAQLRVDAVSISLFKGSALQFAAGEGFQTDAQMFTLLNDGSGLAQRVARERHHVHIGNLQEMNYPSVPARAIKEEGFIAYYGVPLIVKNQLLGVLEIFHRSDLDKNQDWLAFLEMLAGQAAITINSAALFNALQTSNANLQLAHDRTLEGWSRALDLRDKETEGHTRRVTELTLQLARQFGFSEEELTQIKRGALLHDIGKMGIPDSILLKPDSLTAEEWVIMRKHSAYAYELLSPIQYLQPALEIPHYHHERWDGSGYPHGLKGERIPLAARIFAVVDVWDALTSDRPYRAAWEPDKAREYLREGAGAQFDSRVVEIFLKMMENNTDT